MDCVCVQLLRAALSMDEAYAPEVVQCNLEVCVCYQNTRSIHSFLGAVEVFVRADLADFARLTYRCSDHRLSSCAPASVDFVCRLKCQGELRCTSGGVLFSCVAFHCNCDGGWGM